MIDSGYKATPEQIEALEAYARGEITIEECIERMTSRGADASAVH